MENTYVTGKFWIPNELMLQHGILKKNYRFIAETEVVIGRSQPEPRSGEGCDQADHGRPVEAVKVFLTTVSQTNGCGILEVKVTQQNVTNEWL